MIGSGFKKLAQQYPAVKYKGVAPNAVIVEEELKATLLVNPRPTGEEYTKYSFPSKNMEYMASGTPVLTTCLPGMPAEYNEYVYLLKIHQKKKIILFLKDRLYYLWADFLYQCKTRLIQTFLKRSFAF